MIESRQIRAARAMLNWSQSDLASASGVALDTLLQFEDETASVPPAAAGKIQDALEKAGIEFLLGNGVRVRPQVVTMLHGSQAYWALLDDVYQTLLETGGEACVMGMDEECVARALDANPSEGGEKLSRHITRLQKNRLVTRSIIRKGDLNIIAPISWYRCIPEEFFSPHPLYVYGNKIGIIHMGPPFRAVIYDNPEVAETLRRIFNFMWASAEPLQYLRQTA